MPKGRVKRLDINTASVKEFAEAQKVVLGVDHSEPMLAYGTMQKSAAWKMYAKSQNVEFSIANEISEQLRNYENALKHAGDDEKDDIDILDYIDKQYHEIYEKSKVYLGIISDWKIAPCSYLLYQGNIRKEVGLIRAKNNICCLMDGKWAEEYKFLKNDLLKVSVVELIDKVYKRIGIPTHSVNELLDICTFENPAWQIYKKGCTLGINQVEQPGTSRRVSVYAPTNISELCAFIAAIRPGFKSMYKTFEERTPFSYGIKTFDDLIQTEEMPNTFVLYQEMSMATLNYAGIPMTECYEIIKNISKKRIEKVLKYKEQFLKGFSESVIEKENKSKAEADEISHRIWQILEDSSSYSFNACVSGDTKIVRTSMKSRSFHPTIAEMFKICTDKQYAKITNHSELHKKYRNYGYGTTLSMYDDERVRRNKVANIYESGVRQTYEVITETGHSIVCTDNHKFPTPDGIKYLFELSEGDKLYKVGQYEKNKTAHRFTKGDIKINVPSIGIKGFQTREDGASVIFNKSRRFHVEKEDKCEVCGENYCENIRFELHHIDGDSTNNKHENYKWCCVSCHKKLHYKMNRVKQYEKGVPTEVTRIVSIKPHKKEMVYDVEMQDPAHNFVANSGIITSNSHSYCVAIDSLYGAYLKAHYPLQFYEVFLKILEEKGEKDRMNAVKDEAESYFNIKFPSFRYGQDNREISANLEKMEITNSLASIKGFSNSVAKELFEIQKQEYTYFIDLLCAMKSSKLQNDVIEKLIRIDYFRQFGNIRELLRIKEIFDLFSEGESKVIKKEKIRDSDLLKAIVPKYADDQLKSGGISSQYSFTNDAIESLSNQLKLLKKEVKNFEKHNQLIPESLVVEIQNLEDMVYTEHLSHMMKMIRECEEAIKYIGLPDFDYKMKMADQIDLLGYIDLTTNKEEDRRKLLIMDVKPLKNEKGIWGYSVFTRSIGTGKQARLTVSEYRFRKKTLKQKNIIQVEDKDVQKNDKGFWHLYHYEIIA